MVSEGLLRDRSDFAETIDVAAQVLNTSAVIVEKDYWVSQVLMALAADFPEDFIFKGGTSLSKAYGLIQRLSEDVDLLVRKGDRGGGARDSLMKAMMESASAAIPGCKVLKGMADRGVYRIYDLPYPRTRKSDLISPNVRLEMGIRGGVEPHGHLPIGTLLGEALRNRGLDADEWDDLRPFEVAVLHPGRTLVEKLALVNLEAQRLLADDSLEAKPTIGRHFYDIAMLLGDEAVVDFLEDRELFAKVVVDTEEVSKTFFRAFYSRSDAGYAYGPAFAESASVASRLRGSYERSMRELYFGADPAPAWGEVQDIVRRNETLL